MTHAARKPAIWAAATPTGQALNSPTLPLNPKEAPTAPLQSSSEIKADPQGVSQTVSSRVVQSEAPAMEYVTRPKIDAAGKPTGAIEIVPAGVTPTNSSTGAALTGNVVAASEAISRAAEKAREAPNKPETLPNQAGASANKPGAVPNNTGAVPKQAGPAPSIAGASVGSGDEQCWKQSKLDRSTSWKTRQASSGV